MPGDPAPPRDRRTAIIEAALETFLHYGYRRTSLQDVARNAHLSRTALYHHFNDKEDIFRAVSKHVHSTAIARAERAAGLEPVDRAVFEALDSVTGWLIEVVLASRHGHELVDESGRLCGDIAAATARSHRRLVARILSRADAAGEVDLASAGLDARRAAEHLILCAEGLAGPRGDLPSRAEYRQRLRRLVDFTIAGLRPERPSERTPPIEAAARRVAGAKRR